jgi:sugar phosphate isomerase/epimerase
MELGVFAKIFDGKGFPLGLDAVVAAGFRTVQFNVESTGIAPLPDHLPQDVAAAVKQETDARGIRIAALSGTYNMVHPDAERRAADFRRFRVIAQAARSMGADTLTLCSGTRDPENMWRRHPDNDSTAAWDDLIASMGQVLEVAEACDLRVAFEPEPGNVVNSSIKARRLLDTFANKRLGVVIDAVNAMDTAPDRDPRDVLDEAFALLGEDIFVAHAKDHDASGRECQTGTGMVPWAHYLHLLSESSFTGPLIMHGLNASEVAASREYLLALNRKRA